MTPPAGQRWTREKPTEPGWYWWRQDAESEPEIMSVFAYADGSAMPHCDYGEWQGPISPNEATE